MIVRSHRWFRGVLACTLLVGPLSCKPPKGGDGQEPARDGERGSGRRTVQMPRPLPLPAEPGVLLHVADPGLLFATASAYGQDTPSPTEWLADTLTARSYRFEATLVQHLDLHRPWSVVVVGEQPIVHVPLEADGIGVLANQLAAWPTVGEFGAVAIPRAADERGPKLAYLDANARTLTLADDLSGIATGPTLAPAYGHTPLRARVEAGEAEARFDTPLPLSRLELAGRDANDFELTLHGVPATFELGTPWSGSFDPTAAQAFTSVWSQLADGALTGLLEAPMVALGVSSRYANHQKDVGRLLADAKRTVDAQNFLVRGVLEDMLRRFGSVARSWNGRVMLGLGPARHVLVGLGSEDPTKAGGATLHFITGLLDNLKLARTLGLGDVPNVRLARNWGTAAGTPIHALALPGARQYLTPDLQVLVDDRGELKLAFAFPERAGSATVVIGPDSPRVLTRWLEETAGTTSGTESRTHTVAATLAVQPGDLARVLGEEIHALELSATRTPTRVVVERQGERIHVAVRTPAG